jgi:hypothetical protein
MSAVERDALYAKISTGDMTLSHINNQGKLINGTYSTSTLLDKEGRRSEQYSEYGKTPNRAAMQKAENRAMTIELGPNAKKIFTLLDDPASLNRFLNNWAKTHGLSTTEWGNQRSGN